MCAARFVIPMHSPVAALAALAVVGCGSTPQANSQADSGAAQSSGDSEQAATQPAVAQDPAITEKPLNMITARPVAVKTGAAPLVYMLEMTETVQVVDETAGLVIAESRVPRRTILRVDPNHGVIAGRDQLFAGPLPPGRKYGIYIVPEGQNVSRTGRFIPQPTPPQLPQSRPAPARESESESEPPPEQEK